MGNLELSVSIDASTEKVFDILSDLSKGAERMSQIEIIEVLTEGPVQVGTRWKETRMMMGHATTEELTVTQYDPPNRFGVGGESCGTRFDSLFECQSKDNGTEVTFTLDTKSITLFAKLMAPLGWLMMGSMRKCLEQDLADLKKAAETE